jgi:hypothetical protein
MAQNRKKGLECNLPDDQKKSYEKFSRKRNSMGEENQIKRARNNEIGDMLENKGLKGNSVSDMDPIHEGKKLDSNLKQKKEMQRISVPAIKSGYMFKCAKCIISFPNIMDLEKHIACFHEEKKQSNETQNMKKNTIKNEGLARKLDPLKDFENSDSEQEPSMISEAHEGKKLYSDFFYDVNLEQKKDMQRFFVKTDDNKNIFKCAKCNIRFPNIMDL